MIKLIINLNPIPKQADRTWINFKMYNRNNKRAGVILHYQPKEITDYVTAVKKDIRKYKLSMPIDKPIEICYNFYMERPKSKSEKIIWAKWKPDIENLLKAINDAIKEYFMTDDSRICIVHAYKKYAEPGTLPRTEIEIKEMEDI